MWYKLKPTFFSIHIYKLINNSSLTPPRKAIGGISDRYIGTSPALSPLFIPTIKRPTINMTIELKVFEKPI